MPRETTGGMFRDTGLANETRDHRDEREEPRQGWLERIRYNARVAATQHALSPGTPMDEHVFLQAGTPGWTTGRACSAEPRRPR